MGDLGGEEVVTIDDLQQQDVGYCKKGTDVPFTGKTTGQTQGTYKDGVLDGPYVSYYNNGQLRIKGDYKNGERGDPWIDYDKNGTVHENLTGTYKNGVKQ